MPLQRSRTGCLTCRQRKLKCTEEKPTCAQCTRAKRTCIPGAGIVFRHQQNPSLNASHLSSPREGGEEGGLLKSFYGYKETFDRDMVWVDVPRVLRWSHTDNPFVEQQGGGGEEAGGMGGGGGVPEGYTIGVSSLTANTAADAAEDARGGEVDDGEARISATLASGLAALAENANRYEVGGGKSESYGLEALSAVASQDGAGERVERIDPRLAETTTTTT